MSEARERHSKARRVAEALWSRNEQPEAEALTGKEKEREAGALKTLRLRGLRLAKEAAEKEAAAKQAAAPRRRPSSWNKT